MRQILSLFFTFIKIGALTFGGGYAMISLLDYECVEKRKWITSDELMEITVIAESTPGPISINCATYTGYKLSGIKGAVAATIGVILPSFILLFAISKIFESLLTMDIIFHAFKGMRIAVSILMMQVAIKMISRLAKQSPYKKAQIPMIAFVCLFMLIMDSMNIHISTIYFILGSGLVGFVLFRGQKNRGDRK